MKYLPLILADLLLATLVYYGVLRTINFFCRKNLRPGRQQQVFPKLAPGAESGKQQQ